MTLNEAAQYQWYKVVGFNGQIPSRTCIQYIEFNDETRRYHVIGECIFEEIGYYIHEDDAKKIELQALLF